MCNNCSRSRYEQMKTTWWSRSIFRWALSSMLSSSTGCHSKLENKIYPDLIYSWWGGERISRKFVRNWAKHTSSEFELGSPKLLFALIYTTRILFIVNAKLFIVYPIKVLWKRGSAENEFCVPCSILFRSICIYATGKGMNKLLFSYGLNNWVFMS